MNNMSSQKSSERRQEDLEPTRSPWQSEAVIAAIVSAGVAGLFALAIAIFQYATRDVPPMEPAGRSALEAPSLSDLTTGPLSARLTVIERVLGRAGNKFPISLRLEAITALRSIASENPKLDFYPAAVDTLVNYLRHNVDARRGKIDAHATADPRDTRITRPESIISALKALQAISSSAPQPLEVRIGGIDFSFMNLQELDLSGFVMSHSSFRNGILSDCKCNNANFQHADLRETAIWGRYDGKPANFVEVDFTGARLANSKWANVDFTGSNIERADGHTHAWIADEIGLTPKQRELFP